MLKQTVLRAVALAAVALALPGGPAVRDSVALTPAELQAPTSIAALTDVDGRLAEDPRLQRLYQERPFAPLWLDAGQGDLSERGEAAVRALAEARDQGLTPSSYPLREIEAARAAGHWQELDLLVSAGMLDYVTELLRGRNDLRDLAEEVGGDRTPTDPVAAVAELSRAPDLAAALAGFAPQHPQYQRLRATLADLRRAAAEGGWPRVPQGDTLDPGMHDPRVVMLRQRLEQLSAVQAGGRAAAEEQAQSAKPSVGAAQASGSGAGPAPEAAASPEVDSAFFDPALERSVRAFQQRSGLAVDGRVGPNTLEALNRPVGELIAAVEANLERWRWLPRDLGPRYILVNTAGYDLQAVKDDEVVLRMSVVTGMPSRATPMFSAEMSYIEINPTWTIPPTIFAKDYLPELRKNPGYLWERNITLYDSWSEYALPIDPYSVDWHAVPASTRSLPYRLVQSPGPHNALGRIKFMMPNRHSIYLHDTNHRELFSRSRRALSSGCVRLARPDDMARLVLEDAKGWDMERLQRVYASGKQTRVSLERNWPVHMAYFTVWVDEDGTRHFYDDVYGHDRKIMERLESNRTVVAEEPLGIAGRS